MTPAPPCTSITQCLASGLDGCCADCWASKEPEAPTTIPANTNTGNAFLINLILIAPLTYNTLLLAHNYAALHDETDAFYR